MFLGDQLTISNYWSGWLPGAGQWWTGLVTSVNKSQWVKVGGTVFVIKCYTLCDCQIHYKSNIYAFRKHKFISRSKSIAWKHVWIVNDWTFILIQNHEPNFNNVSPFVYHLPNLHFNCEVVKQYFRISNVVRGPTLHKLFHGRFRNVTTIYFIYSQTHMGDMSLDGGADWMRPSDPLPLVTTYVRGEERSIKSSTILPQLLCQTNV